VRATGFLRRDRYVVYVPENFDRARQWPVILFLHGAGERGTDGFKHTEVGLGRAIRIDPERFPVIAVFPQATSRWLDDEARFAIRALEEAAREFNGDPDRVYLTGLSLGGYGTWHLALEHRRRFAALVPVCGGITAPENHQVLRQSPLTLHAEDPYAFAAETLREIPVWIFHGTEDRSIPASESRTMHEELRSRGADVRYTEFPGVGHNSWDPAYATAELWTWLLEQRRER
jgi:predicted peptidase